MIQKTGATSQKQAVFSNSLVISVFLIILLQKYFYFIVANSAIKNECTPVTINIPN